MIESTTITCCQEIPAAVSTDVDDSLIAQMVVTDYYDGPISGFLRCPSCNRVYHFITLDWDKKQGVRVISLAEVPCDTFDKLSRFFGQAPNRKQWIPKMLSRATEEDLDRIEPFIAGLASQAKEPSIVLAWDRYSDELLAARRTDKSVSEYIIHLFQRGDSRFDWFAHLGLSRSEGLPLPVSSEVAVAPSREDVLRKIAESQLDHRFEGLDASLKRELAASLARQWSTQDGHAGLVTPETQFWFLLVSRGGDGYGVEFVPERSHLLTDLRRAGVQEGELPEVLHRLNLSQAAVCGTAAGQRIQVRMNPKERTVTVASDRV